MLRLRLLLLLLRLWRSRRNVVLPVIAVHIVTAVVEVRTILPVTHTLLRMMIMLTTRSKCRKIIQIIFIISSQILI